ESESHVDQIVWKRKDVEYSFSKFDLTLYIEGKGGEYQAVFEYSTDLFDRRTIQRMATHWQTLLGGVVQKPDGLLSTFPLMMSDERQRLLVDWNRTKVDYPSDSCIHQLFEKQVERAPRAVAVRCGDVEWTYQELNDQANRIAHQLLGMGVNIGESVAIMVPRSNEMIAAVLGVLKSGAAYVPIEPTLPDQRIDEICRQVQVSTVITHSSLREKGYRLQTDTLTGVIFIDHADLSVHLTRLDTIASYADWIKQPGVNPKLSLSSRSLAYILFTSGSTGKPKGVKVQHRSVVNLVDWVNRTFHIRSQDRGLSVVSLSFDLSVYDLFGLLAAGASIQLATDEERNNPFQLVRLLYQEPITFWNSAPAALQQLIPYCEQWKEHREKSHLRYVFVSGDWHPVSLPDRVRQAFPHAHIVNLGGPTETTVWSNYYPVDQVDPRWSSIPYGKPIQNVMFYV
ncbi:non-ribosomal peptide synthetase, partial [Fischerella thermalis CCMEE 5273]